MNGMKSLCSFLGWMFEDADGHLGVGWKKTFSSTTLSMNAKPESETI
jgi:hypothetical protein